MWYRMTLAVALCFSIVGQGIAFGDGPADTPTKQSAKSRESGEGARVSAQKAPAKPVITRAPVKRVQPSNIDEKATHQQAAIIKVSNDAKQPAAVNTFCLTKSDQILVGCGAGPGTVRLLDAAGKPIRSWSVPMKPEAIGITPDGIVLVGGVGQLFRFTLEGEQLTKAEAPHLSVVKGNAKKIREQIVEKMKSRSTMYVRQLELYAKRIKVFEDKGEDKLSDLEKRQLAAYRRAHDSIKRLVAQNGGGKADDKTDNAAVDAQVEKMILSKMRIASISAAGKDVFIACPSTTGYTYDVWRMDNDFTNGKMIVTGLRGCCGQMDVQANDNGVYVAENSRGRVCRYDRKGTLVTTWGKKDRTGVDGFTSCCNPMNVCFGSSGDVFTAESNTGRIKRFSEDGDLLDFVGDIKLVPGCKNVSIAVNGDKSSVYMLDITRKHIVRMARKEGSKTSAESE